MSTYHLKLERKARSNHARTQPDPISIPSSKLQPWIEPGSVFPKKITQNHACVAVALAGSRHLILYPRKLVRAFLDQPGCGAAFNHRNDLDLSAPGLHFARASHRIRIVVAAFDDHLWPDGHDQLQWCWFCEYHHGVDGGQRGQHAGSFALTHHGTDRKSTRLNSSH